jgi:NADP-dependent 3-hydroxy acid dehydrogenase YdfG
MELSNKTAVITGASSGIGAAVARNLNQAGVSLVLTGRREDRLVELKKELTGAEILPGDITNPALPDNLIQMALQSFGHCDIVFNNAGTVVMGTIEDIDIEKVCTMVRVNVEAAYRMAYVALKHFKSTNSGFLLNTSSIVGTKVRPTGGAYAGTKHAIEALTEGFRMELAKTNIAVACIEPGLVQTEIFRDWDEFPAAQFDIPNPLQPEDIARVVRFILEQPDHVRIPRVLAIPADQAL